MTAQSKGQITLPQQLVSSIDLARITRELEALDESLHQSTLRKPGQPTKLARSSITLEDLARLNGVSLMDPAHRSQLIKLLHALHEHAPRIRISLAAEPSGTFIQKIAVWMRENIQSTLLLDVGLQPTLSAGCTIRTNNKVFDMSLRHRFEENRALLMEKIKEAGT